MLTEVEQTLVGAGVDAKRILIERFGEPVDAAPIRDEVATQRSAAVTVIVDGVRRDIQLEGSEQSILEAARAAGLDLPFSCKSGVCATCRARVLEGEVHMRRNFALLKGDLQAGMVLTCQARPVTPRVVVSFDDR
jgi:ring-1,2-phenylacetyl-CoA epoxidase subunit PaaE